MLSINIWGKQMGLKLNFELKQSSFNWREVTHFYNKTKYLT